MTPAPEVVVASAPAGSRLADVAKSAAMKAERTIIEDTLQQVHWNRRRAAEQLGVSYKTLLNKIKECGISRAMTGLRGAFAGVLLTLFTTVPATLRADTVQLSLHDGRVSLVATNATPAQIFEAWSRAGGVLIVNAERMPVRADHADPRRRSRRAGARHPASSRQRLPRAASRDRGGERIHLRSHRDSGDAFRRARDRLPPRHLRRPRFVQRRHQCSPSRREPSVRRRCRSRHRELPPTRGRRSIASSARMGSQSKTIRPERRPRRTIRHHRTRPAMRPTVVRPGHRREPSRDQRHRNSRRHSSSSRSRPRLPPSTSAPVGVPRPGMPVPAPQPAQPR